MSYETDFMDAMCENLGQLNDSRQRHQETVATIASSTFVRRLMTLYHESDYQDFDKWLSENYELLVAPFSGGSRKPDPYLQFVFDMAKRSRDSRAMLAYIAQSVNDRLRNHGFKRGFNANLFFIEDI